MNFSTGDIVRVAKLPENSHRLDIQVIRMLFESQQLTKISFFSYLNTPVVEFGGYTRIPEECLEKVFGV